MKSSSSKTDVILRQRKGINSNGSSENGSNNYELPLCEIPDATRRRRKGSSGRKLNNMTKFRSDEREVLITFMAVTAIVFIIFVGMIYRNESYYYFNYSSLQNDASTGKTTTEISRGEATTTRRQRNLLVTNDNSHQIIESSKQQYPSIVRLPQNYPANLTLNIDNNGDDQRHEKTLDDLHNEGRFQYATFINPDFRVGIDKETKNMGVKFRNFQGRTFEKRWDDGSKDGIYNGEISGVLGSRGTTNTYVGHAFKFVDKKTKELFQTIRIVEGKHLYILEPDKDDVKTRESKEYIEAKEEERFMNEYYEQHHTPWLSKYGRPKPVLNMWPADYVGQVHNVISHHPYWHCADTTPDANCQGSESVSLNMTVVSHSPLGPRVLVIENLMSEVECDHIVELGKKVVHESLVGDHGGFKSNSRTSSTGWLSRKKTEILKTVHLRFADVLGIDEETLTTTAEQLQIVNYKKTQQYLPHHDFGDDGTDEQRFLTLLLYIQTPKDGGATGFPKAFGGKGMRVKPPKGGAVLFYSMLPDGNGDDLSLHAGEPVTEGEKWACNLWVWDPKRN